MDRAQKHRLITEIICVTAVLFSIACVFYFIYHEPFEMIGDPITDKILADLNRQDMIFHPIIGLGISLTVSMLLVSIFESLIMNTLPIIEVQARLKQKEYYYQSSSPRTGSMLQPAYTLIYELSDGTEKKFFVDPILYSAYLKGNKGILRYKERIFRRFIGFFIESVE